MTALTAATLRATDSATAQQPMFAVLQQALPAAMDFLVPVC